VARGRISTLTLDIGEETRLSLIAPIACLLQPLVRALSYLTVERYDPLIANHLPDPRDQPIPYLCRIVIITRKSFPEGSFLD